jgi:hypothetical protein
MTPAPIDRASLSAARAFWAAANQTAYDFVKKCALLGKMLGTHGCPRLGGPIYPS